MSPVPSRVRVPQGQPQQINTANPSLCLPRDLPVPLGLVAVPKAVRHCLVQSTLSHRSAVGLMVTKPRDLLIPAVLCCLGTSVSFPWLVPSLQQDLSEQGWWQEHPAALL